MGVVGVLAAASEQLRVKLLFLFLLLLQLFLVRRKTFETFLETLHGKNGRLAKHGESERM